MYGSMAQRLIIVEKNKILFALNDVRKEVRKLN